MARWDQCPYHCLSYSRLRPCCIPRLHSSPTQPLQPPDRSSMFSETSLTLGTGFSKAVFIASMRESSCFTTRCRRSVTEAGVGVSGLWSWHQHCIALCREIQRANRIRDNGRENRVGQAWVMHNKEDSNNVASTKSSHMVTSWKESYLIIPFSCPMALVLAAPSLYPMLKPSWSDASFPWSMPST